MFYFTRVHEDPRVMYMDSIGCCLSHTPETWERWGKSLHVDKSVPIRFVYWSADMLKGELGWDKITREDVLYHLPGRVLPTLKLGLLAWTIAVVAGLSLGILSALSRSIALDRASRWLFLMGQSAPSFLVGIFGLVLFSVWIGWLPLHGMGEGFSIRYYALPVVALASLPVIMYMRFTRLAALDAMDARLVARARARGVGYGAIMRRYAARRVLASALAVTSQSLTWFVTGLVVVEFLFHWPGLGQYSALGHWYMNIDPAVAVALIGAIALSGAKLILDILRRVVDPKMECAW